MGDHNFEYSDGGEIMCYDPHERIAHRRACRQPGRRPQVLSFRMRGLETIAYRRVRVFWTRITKLIEGNRTRIGIWARIRRRPWQYVDCGRVRSYASLLASRN